MGALKDFEVEFETVIYDKDDNEITVKAVAWGTHSDGCVSHDYFEPDDPGELYLEGMTLGGKAVPEDELYRWRSIVEQHL